MPREGMQFDHQFELSPFCDCDSCNELCHYHYGQEDACILERHLHAPVVDGHILRQNERLEKSNAQAR